MRALWCLPLLLAGWALADDASSIRKAIALFNDTHHRDSVLAPGADLSALDRFRGQEISQLYFEPGRIRFVESDVAVVNVTGSQYGSLIGKRTVFGQFVLRKHGAVWRIERLTLRDAHTPSPLASPR